jgi:hypothetical protein
MAAVHGTRNYDQRAMREFPTCVFLLNASNGAHRSIGRISGVTPRLENVPKGWKARYVVTRNSDDEYHEMLELDPNGKGFKPYVTNRFLKVSPPSSAE